MASLDAVTKIAARDETARAALVLVLGVAVDDRDRSVAAAARQAILRLLDAELDVGSDATSAAHEVAFQAWWMSDAGRNHVANGLERYADVPDRFPEDILLVYLDQPSMLVGREAYRALGRVKASPGSSRAAWLASRPRFTNEAWVREAWEATRSALRDWSRGRPR